MLENPSSQRAVLAFDLADEDDDDFNVSRNNQPESVIAAPIVNSAAYSGLSRRNLQKSDGECSDENADNSEDRRHFKRRYRRDRSSSSQRKRGLRRSRSRSTGGARGNTATLKRSDSDYDPLNPAQAQMAARQIGNLQAAPNRNAQFMITP